MRHITPEPIEHMGNPIDLVERLAQAQEWPCERRSDEEVAIAVTGQWGTYRLWFAWHAELAVLQLSATLDIKVPAKRMAAVQSLLALANEKLWLGHFELWQDEPVPVFRHAQIFRDGNQVGPELVDDLIDVALTECERFYPAFHFVISGNRRPADAIAGAMLETEGEA